MTTELQVSEEELRRLYIDEALTQEEIADRLDTSPSTIRTLMKKYNIQARRAEEGWPWNHTDESPWNDPDTLRSLYHDKGLIQSEIADRLGCSQGLISRKMKEYDIDTRG